MKDGCCKRFYYYAYFRCFLPYTERLSSVNRTHSYWRGNRCFAYEFQCSHSLGFVVIIVTRKFFSKLVVCLNISKISQHWQTQSCWSGFPPCLVEIIPLLDTAIAETSPSYNYFQHYSSHMGLCWQSPFCTSLLLHSDPMTWQFTFPFYFIYFTNVTHIIFVEYVARFGIAGL